jgi:hypothetical protein
MSFYDLPNVGIYLDTFNPFLFQRIKNEVGEFVAEFKNTNTIDNESKDLLRLFQKKKEGYTADYKLSGELVSLIDKEILKLIHQYELKYQYFDRMFNYSTSIENHEVQIELERIWVNLQRAGEFLPLHNHSGLYSFVIWTSVPYLIADEKDNTANPDLIKNRTANFEFVYTDTLGKVNNYPVPVDTAMEGKICIFPSELQHQVYPFYSSSGVRVSVAGNYRLGIVS